MAFKENSRNDSSVTIKIVIISSSGGIAIHGVCWLRSFVSSLRFVLGLNISKTVGDGG